MNNVTDYRLDQIKTHEFMKNVHPFYKIALIHVALKIFKRVKENTNGTCSGRSNESDVES